jgi:indole-3-acetate monooxygenase
MIGCDGGYVTAFLDESVARKMYPDIWVATAATATATGQATPVRGGYRVSGRFPFSSGCQHSSTMYSCPLSGLSVSRIPNWSSGLDRYTRFR